MQLIVPSGEPNLVFVCKFTVQRGKEWQEPKRREVLKKGGTLCVSVPTPYGALLALRVLCPCFTPALTVQAATQAPCPSCRDKLKRVGP